MKAEEAKAAGAAVMEGPRALVGEVVREGLRARSESRGPRAVGSYSVWDGSHSLTSQNWHCHGQIHILESSVW